MQGLAGAPLAPRSSSLRPLLDASFKVHSESTTRQHVLDSSIADLRAPCDNLEHLLRTSFELFALSALVADLNSSLKKAVNAEMYDVALVKLDARTEEVKRGLQCVAEAGHIVDGLLGSYNVLKRSLEDLEQQEETLRQRFEDAERASRASALGHLSLGFELGMSETETARKRVRLTRKYEGGGSNSSMSEFPFAGSLDLSEVPSSSKDARAHGASSSKLHAGSSRTGTAAIATTTTTTKKGDVSEGAHRVKAKGEDASRDSDYKPVRFLRKPEHLYSMYLEYRNGELSGKKILGRVPEWAMWIGVDNEWIMPLFKENEEEDGNLGVYALFDSIIPATQMAKQRKKFGPDWREQRVYEGDFGQCRSLEELKQQEGIVIAAGKKEKQELEDKLKPVTEADMGRGGGGGGNGRSRESKAEPLEGLAALLNAAATSSNAEVLAGAEHSRSVEQR
jgi:hypothetical protein